MSYFLLAAAECLSHIVCKAVYEVKALFISSLQLSYSNSKLPEETNNTVVQVCVAEVVARNPNITSISNELTHKSLPLAFLFSYFFEENKYDGTYASKARPFSLLSSSALTFSSGVFSEFSFLAAA